MTGSCPLYPGDREFCEPEKEYSISEVAMEALIYVKNPRSLMLLAQIRGALVAGIHNANPSPPIKEYLPNVVKKACTGNGHAKKEYMEYILTLTLGVRQFQSLDESDALSLAMCHCLMKNSSLI